VPSQLTITRYLVTTGINNASTAEIQHLQHVDLKCLGVDFTKTIIKSASTILNQ
jgi:hypothetical protein